MQVNLEKLRRCGKKHLRINENKRWLLGTYYDANLLISSENNWELLTDVLIQEEWE